LTDDPTGKLGLFADLLLRWNTTLNLIAARDADVLWERHIADSLQLVKLIPEGVERAVDLGTGGGFPGLVLAIATGIRFDLIESDRRKASFLRTVILATEAPATVHACRIEDAPVPPARLVTARALAPLPRLLPLAARFRTADGVCLFLKGARLDQEVATAERDWTMTISRIPSQTSVDGVILRITDMRMR
jgi:16S rRNA (guanine527-N7)-methyltransferase